MHIAASVGYFVEYSVMYYTVLSSRYFIRYFFFNYVAVSSCGTDPKLAYGANEAILPFSMAYLLLRRYLNVNLHISAYVGRRFVR
jgi:hypothetical protein